MVRRISDWASYGSGDNYGLEPWYFVIDYRNNHPHPTLSSPLDIAIEMYSDIKEPITVMLSGGIDSQASAYAAKLSGRDCRFVSFRYNNGLNDHDLDDTFYKENEINIEYIDFDIIDFHENELLEWGHRYKTASPHILSHMKMASLFDGVVVLSGDSGIDELGGLNYQTIGLERFAETHPLTIGYMFNTSPHFFNSMTSVYKTTSGIPYERKYKTYQCAGFPVRPQTTKQHGFEKLKEYYDDRVIPLMTRLSYKNKPSRRPYDILFRYSLSCYDKFRSTHYFF